MNIGWAGSTIPHEQIRVYGSAQRARGLPGRVIRKTATGRRQNRKCSFAFSERTNSWASMVALTGEGHGVNWVQ